MRPAGDDRVIVRWREAGEWWKFEPYREFVQYLDEHGIRRTSSSELPSLGRVLHGAPAAFTEDHREEYELRIRKIRDEKVAAACGVLPREYYEDKRGDSIRTSSAEGYVPLHTMSGYAFGHSLLHAEAIPGLASTAGCPACAIADPFSLVGAYEFAKSARKHGVRPIIGASFELDTGGTIVLLAKSKRGYRALSLLITDCHLGEPRGFPILTWERLERRAVDLVCLTGGDAGPVNQALIRRDRERARKVLERLVQVFGRADTYAEMERCLLPWEAAVNRELEDLAQSIGVACVAGVTTTHARPENFPAQDILVCSNSLCLVDEVVGRKETRVPGDIRRPDRALNAERYFQTSAEFSARFADKLEWVNATRELADRCDSDVLPSRAPMPQLYPDDAHALRELTFLGAHRLHSKITAPLKKRLNFELDRIIGLNFCPHFLVAHDFCRWAQLEGIQQSGRGSVVDSAVAYCLGFSRIDAFAHNLHFDRFLPADGSKRPDIDVDFEARRRDDVRNYITRKYGKDHVATVAAVGAFLTRGIIREVGKAMGLSEEAIGFLAKRLHGSISPEQMESAIDRKPELRNSGIPKERFQWVFHLAKDLMDIPRNIRCHSSGVVVSSTPLAEIVPLMHSESPGLEEGDGLRIMQWDKRSAKHCFDKFDILCLRGQDVLSGVEDRVRVTTPAFDVTRVPIDDSETYRAMRSGELIGIPQSASPAMRQAHVRLRTENLHDASLVQAGIRPGVGGAVKINTLIRRRRGLEAYTFEHPELEAILGLTYGIIVFQEQVDQLLQTFGGYTSDEAEEIRDLIHKRRREDYGQTIREEMLAKIVGRGYSPSVALQVFDYVAGFKVYGFAQGHALAFAEVSIRSIYLQQNYPAEYFASLLAAQPAGYYGPCTIANEARSRGVAILPVDVNASRDRFEVEAVRSLEQPEMVFPSGGIRVGFAQVSGLSTQLRTRIAESAMSSYEMECDLTNLVRFQTAIGLNRNRAFTSIFDFATRTKPNRDELENLILCGAFDSLHPNRRALLWSVPDILNYAHGGIAQPGELDLQLPEPRLPTDVEDFSREEKAIYERSILGMDLHAHLMAFERERVASRGAITSRECQTLEPGRKAIVVGNPIRLRFPPTSSGKRVVFFDLEDESGLLNTTCFDDVYQRDGHAIICSGYVTVIGEVQDRDGHKAFLAHRVFPYQPQLQNAVAESQRIPVATADFLVG